MNPGERTPTVVLGEFGDSATDPADVAARRTKLLVIHILFKKLITSDWPRRDAVASREEGDEADFPLSPQSLCYGFRKDELQESLEATRTRT